ncbi:hypothetical protein M409DRAFT_61300 [Zasmidium cellare ATCC 36951]|uniref:Uncharacterized protein n=1 Tax=Zasmidium cellare ATCC 36951 TaxID=1080233 RepID=A0A6A6BY65_ZASCE|nr:uncharacterized protein M409DRAFT_61300 [Zasmidium cellare ATCC 36951]KAF2158880.1 hypothetical protein M409DRAFT_61300 [Zasmidium cellare ATCC 36951]
MHYIRFLKTPKIHVDKGAVLLKAVVTVTTDLGETFYPDELDLVVTLRAHEEDGEIFLRKKAHWQAGPRSLGLVFDLSRQDIEYPACVHVAVKNQKNYGFLPPIADVWSGTLNPTKGRFETGHRVERRFTSLSERRVSLLEDAGDSIARHLWDGSQALAQHIDRTISLDNPSTLPLFEYVLISATYRKLNVIELGAGCGTVGISIAQSIPDCDILLTDLPEVTELVEANIARMKPAMSSRVRFEPLDWLAPLPEKLQTRTNDLIVVSECTYNTDTLEPLVGMLVSLVTRSPKAVIVVSTKTRHDSEAAFFDLMKNAGFIDEGSMRLPLPGQPGTGYADWATDVGMHLFRGRDHRLSLSPRNGSEEEVPKAASAKRARSR